MELIHMLVFLIKKCSLRAIHHQIPLRRKPLTVIQSRELLRIRFLRPPWKHLYKGNHKGSFRFSVLMSSFFHISSHFDLAGSNCYRLDPSSAEPSVSNRGQPVTLNQEGSQVSIELKGPPTRSSLEVLERTLFSLNVCS